MGVGGAGVGGLRSIAQLHVDSDALLNAVWKSNFYHFYQVFNKESVIDM